MKLDLIPVDLIDEASDNPNRMPAHKYQALKASMKRGIKQNIVVQVNGDRFIARDGNHRTRAARELGIPALPAFVVQDEAEAKALMISMNNTRGEIDLGLAAGVIADLHNNAKWSLDDLAVTGYTQQELNDLLAAVGDPTPDDIIADGLPAAPLEDEREGNRPGKALLLEIEFDDEEAYRLCKKALKRAGGGSMAAGLVAMVEGNNAD
jgi:hypothetical protein